MTKPPENLTYVTGIIDELDLIALSGELSVPWGSMRLIFTRAQIPAAKLAFFEAYPVKLMVAPVHTASQTYHTVFSIERVSNE